MATSRDSPSSSFIKEQIHKYPEFEQYLKERKLYGRYITNVKKQMNGNRYRQDNFIQKCTQQAKRIIDQTLTWSVTREGHSFWSNVNDDFVYHHRIQTSK